MFCKADVGPGFSESLIVFRISDSDVIKISDGNCAENPRFIAAIAYIGGFLQMITVFPLKIRAGLITGGA
jgi:hypothetical protein